MKKKSAFVLAAVFFLMVVFILLTAALFRLVPQEVRWSGDHRRETLAYYAATSGFKHALAWMRQVKLGGGDPFLPGPDQPYERATLASPGSYPLRLLPASDRQPTGPDTYFPPNLPELRSKPGRIVLGDNWCAEVHIVPDKRTAPHPFLRGAAGNLPPAYTLVALAFRDYNSNGACDSGENYAMRCEASLVERTFARYAYFVDSWPDNGSETPALALLPAMTEALFGGPVHSNDTPVLQVLDANRFWSESSFISPFGNELSFAGDRGTPKVDDSFDGVAYLGGNFRGNDALQRPYIDADPDEAIDSRYRRLYREGQAAIRRTQPIQLPTDWSRLLANAWGVESGREVAPASAASQQVYVNREDLGIVSTGSLRELRLDVVDNQGRSLVFNNNGEVTGTPSLGSQALLLAQQQEVTYLVTETRDIISETVSTETGPYTLTETQYSDVPQAGYSPSTYEETYGSTTVPMQSFMITGYTTVNDPPGGAGPATGGTIRIPEYTSTTVDYSVPLTREATRYVRVDVISGNGTYQVTHQEVTGQEEVLVPRTFVPQDLVITATDEAVRLPINYLTPNNTSVDEYPVFTGDQSGLEVNVPQGKSLVIRRDRQMGRTYQVELRDQAPNGVVAVWGNVTNLRGVNRGGKTILATGANGTGLGNITLNDHLLQFGLAPGTPPSRGGNSLGIIGNNIFLDSNPLTLARFTAARPLFLHASLFAAGGGFAAANLAAANRVAELRVVGGVLQRSIGTLLEGSKGWSSRYRYDNYLHLDPPPSFPADGRFDLTFFRVTRP